MSLATTTLFLAFMCALHTTVVEGATLPLRRTDGRQRLCPTPFRTLPDLNAIHGNKRTFRPSRHFLREWCPPDSPIIFPSRRPTTTTIWGRDVANRFNGPQRSNPHHGAAVEGGSVRITFPGQHITSNPPSSPDRSSEEDTDVEFINSKMHPSLLRPRARLFLGTQQGIDRRRGEAGRMDEAGRRGEAGRRNEAGRRGEAGRRPRGGCKDVITTGEKKSA